ncbi:hypothetical protein D3C71_1794090 [compost metagenome]
MNRHGRAVLRQAGEFLSGWHGGFVGVARQDHALRNVRQGQFRAQERCASGCGSHAGYDFERNAQFTQIANLLANGAIQARIARVHPGHILAFGVGGLDQVDDLFQVQFGAVDHLFGTVTFQYGGRHQ